MSYNFAFPDDIRIKEAFPLKEKSQMQNTIGTALSLHWAAVLQTHLCFQQLTKAKLAVVLPLMLADYD